jgi:anaerobic magnesium-protoporphyrin IX monomethyl ester cyclase
MKRSSFKVLFIYPNTMMATLVPLSISSLYASLKSKGFTVEVFDTTYYKTEEESFEQRKVDLLMVKPFSFKDQGIEIKKEDINKDLVKKISEYKPDLIAITIVQDTNELSRSLLENIKDLDIPVVAGGVFASLSPEEVIADKNIDIICIGEGEEPLVELCEKMSKSEDYSGIRNLWVKKNGTLIKNPLRPLLDINKLPFIDYDIFGRERLYRPMFGKVYAMIHVELDRGCPYTCTFCCAPALKELYSKNGCGQYYRRKNVDHIMAEMRHLVKKYKPDYVNFNSETFLAKPITELREFAKRYKEMAIPFWCQTRPETVTEEKIKLLKDMNCNSLQFGIEVGNEEFRNKVLNRRDTNEQMLKAFKLVEKYKIPYTANNIIGFPDETRELIFETIEFNRKINPRTMNCNIMAPYKGTAIYKYCMDKGYLNKDSKVHQVIDGAELKMDSISYKELKGLQRTFALYARFPKSEWPKIKIAENFDEEGNRMFAELKQMYQKKYFS